MKGEKIPEGLSPVGLKEKGDVLKVKIVNIDMKEEKIPEGLSPVGLKEKDDVLKEETVNIDMKEERVWDKILLPTSTQNKDHFTKYKFTRNQDINSKGTNKTIEHFKRI